ncbi:sugar ABC transporter permease [Brachybacterium sp. p3-SID957]|uniref:ABC transporter permease n=1 Tax=Brachybacterium sp. p3-SID957 TaxID=2916049 RepID=UPI00223B6877|nr:ABC transporter permease subunit [Brachybacterium sp. p3-SID957]MCT1776277.1 ABC transporter permease subunit [Brachybacterium sp. p3-SID957]
MTGRRLTFWQKLWRDRMLLMFALPGFMVLLIYHYYPLLGNIIAFKNYRPYRGVWGSDWVALDNFRVIFEGDPAFMNALTNTLILTLLQAVLVFPAPVVLALLLNSLLSERIKRVIQSILYLPHFLSWVVVVALFQQLLGGSGLLNNFLRSHGYEALSIIGNGDLFRPLLLAQVMWKDTGWATIIFLAALATISADLYEAAAVDGAGRWRQMIHVTIPGLKGVVILLFILQLGTSLTVGFEQILLQQNAVGLQKSEVLDTYVYNRGVIGGNWGMATAVGLVKSVVGVILVLGANKIAHMFGEAGVYATRSK